MAWSCTINDVVNFTCLLGTLVLCGQCNGQVKEAFVIDTLVVMDAPAFSTWVNRQSPTLTSSQKQEKATESIKEYILLLIKQANDRLESLDDDNEINWTIRLSVADFSIGSDPLRGSLDILSSSIPYQTALTTFQVWVATQENLKAYDYVLLLTGYNLQGTVNLPYEIKGIANIGAMCRKDGTSIAIVEDRGGFQSAHFVAHEFGHSLGSKHDGEIPNTDCPETDRYLMAINEEEVTSSNLVNPWYFSQCSKRSMDSFVQTDALVNHPSCLRDTLPVVPEFEDTANLLPGQVYGLNAQCQQLLGTSSTVCSGDQYKLSDVCNSLPCYDPSPGSGAFTCQLYRAAEGSSCGTGKICQKGLCVRSALAPATEFTDCYFGDAIVSLEGFTCSQYIRTNPIVCYNSTIRSACCESCRTAQTQSDVCPYGDRKSGCTLDHCQHIDVDGTRLEETCCGTCGYDVIKPCMDAPTLDGMLCRERVSLNQIQECYDTRVAYHCCATCARIRTSVKDCEYGDKTVSNRCEGLAYDEKTCQQYGTQCCHTCSNLDGNTATRTLFIGPVAIFALRIISLVVVDV